MAKLFLLLFLLITSYSFSQELFVWAEPASNMPSKVWGVRSSNYLAQNHTLSFRNELEVMYGVSRKLMLHTSLIASNSNANSYRFDGVNIYLKYRFYNKDGNHKHFRLAAFGRAAYCDNRAGTTEINLEGDNTGMGIGLIATKLIHKIAISNSLQYSEGKIQNAFYNSVRVVEQFSDVVSIGYLAHPKKYVSYKQTNINFYLEAMFTRANYNEITRVSYLYVDIAPALQFIFNSQTRLDLSYRKRLLSQEKENHYRFSILLRLQHDFLN